MRFLLLGSMLLALLVGATASVAAQEATPAGGGCTVEPRTEEELLALSATPYVPSPSPVVATPATMPPGEMADEATVAAITDTVNQVAACAEAGDINRLLALYSDRYVVAHIFAREPQPIIPGHPRVEGQTLPATPAATPVTSMVRQAHVLPNNRIAATVVTGEEIDIVTFVKSDDGRWVIDDIEPVTSGHAPASPAATPGGTSQYPPPVQAAIRAAADRLNLPQDQLTVDTVEQKNWPDTSLGCPKEGHFYAQVITPGYLVVITGGGKHVEYHTDAHDTVVFCGEK
ncbi:MAG: hypothetical protein ACJ789_14440 [Thermomicrobiales bacterium]